MKLTNKQKEFIKNFKLNKRYNIKSGATRSGKTYLDILFTIPKRVRERAGLDGLNVILGVSKSTIDRNVLEPMRELYGNDLISPINSQNIAILFGEPVYCLGAEKVSQVSKIRGASVKYCYCDELAEYNKEVFELLKSRLDKEYSVLDATLNPESPTHWLKQFIDRKDIDIYVQSYTIFDNPFLPKEFVESLCKEYEGTVYYNRYILGQWCNAEGLIFNQIANKKEDYIIDYDIGGALFIGIDWGGNGSYHSITATRMIRDCTKIEVLASERLKATGTDTKALFRWIINFIKSIFLQYGKISAIYCDSAEQVLINSLRGELKTNEVSIPVYDSLKVPISERIKGYNILLNTGKLLFLNKKCDTLIEAFQTALYDEKAPDDRWIDDGETSDIDSLDSFNYSIEHYLNQLTRRINYE